jgi:hypothetical protein
MTIDQQAQAALDQADIKWPASMPVVELHVEDYTDWTGDEALQVMAVIDENADIELMTGDDASNLKTAIRDCIRAAGITRFVYIRLAKPSDLVPSDED